MSNRCLKSRSSQLLKGNLFWHLIVPLYDQIIYWTLTLFLVFLCRVAGLLRVLSWVNHIQDPSLSICLSLSGLNLQLVHISADHYFYYEASIHAFAQSTDVIKYLLTLTVTVAITCKSQSDEARKNERIHFKSFGNSSVFFVFLLTTHSAMERDQ